MIAQAPKQAEQFFVITSLAETSKISSALLYSGATILFVIKNAAHNLPVDREHATFIAGREPRQRGLRREHRFAFG